MKIPSSIATAVIALSGALPYASPANAQSHPADSESQVSFLFETFSTSVEEAAALLRNPSDDEQLYQRVLQLTKQGKASEDLVRVFRTKSGQRGVSEAIDEYIYATEFEPPDVKPADKPAGEKKPSDGKPEKTDAEKQKTDPAPSPAPEASSATATGRSTFFPSAFTTRNIGETLELQPGINADGKTIDLSIVTQFVQYIGDHDEGGGVVQPTFQTQKLTTSVTVQSGTRYLLGTLNRPISSGYSTPDPAHVICLEFLLPTVINVAGGPVLHDQPRASAGASERR